MKKGELLLDDYEVYRNERESGYGGVMLCINKSYNSELIFKSEKTESIYCKINQKGKKPTILACCYRPPINNLDYTLQVCQELAEIKSKYKKSNLLVGGDFNLPDINWESESIDRSQYLNSINTSFMDTFKDLGLSQIIKTPTRGDSILDLFLTSNENLICDYSVGSGIGDHDFVTVGTSLHLQHKKPTRRTIHLWNKVKLDKIKEDARNFNNLFMSKHKNNNNVQVLWNCLKTNLLSIMDDNVPTKLSSTKNHQPWITTETKRILRKKQRWYTKAKSCKSDKAWNKYKQIKKASQMLCRKAHSDYVQDLISDDKNNLKKP